MFHKEVIYFYGSQDSICGYLSNFYMVEFRYDGVLWASSEHTFQCSKTFDLRYTSKIISAKTPKEAKRLGRKCPLREDWEDVKDLNMFKICLAKFEQNELLGNKLISTGDSILVEHVKWDNYWGDGSDGNGKNMMGKTLMYVRSVLNYIE